MYAHRRVRVKNDAILPSIRFNAYGVCIESGLVMLQSEKSSTDRDAILRPVKIVVCGILFVALVWHGLWIPWRALTLLTIASAFSGALFYELASRDAPRQWTVIGLIAIWTLTGISWLILDRAYPLNPHWSGPLIAADDPTPQTPCGAPPPDGLLMLFGPDAVTARGNGPFTPVRIGTCPALTVKRTPDGLMVDAFGYDSDGNVVYRIADNRFEIIVRGFLKIERPDKSSLRIVDDVQRETLLVRYMNRNTVSVRGTFRCGDAPAVTISDGRIAFGKTRITRPSCRMRDAAHPTPVQYATAPD